MAGGDEVGRLARSKCVSLACSPLHSGVLATHLGGSGCECSSSLLSATCCLVCSCVGHCGGEMAMWASGIGCATEKG